MDIGIQHANQTKAEIPICTCDESWEALPRRLRGRGDWLLSRGRIKDAEMMFDAATEIEGLRIRCDR